METPQKCVKSVSKLTIKTPETASLPLFLCLYCNKIGTDFTQSSCVSVDDFEQVNAENVVPY